MGGRSAYRHGIFLSGHNVGTAEDYDLEREFGGVGENDISVFVFELNFRSRGLISDPYRDNSLL